MFGRILIALIVVPIVELWIVAQVAGQINWLPTIGIVLAVSLIGAYLVRREGSGAWNRIQQAASSGTMPSKELADGALVVFGGTLLLTPGFLTDLVGIAMMIPPLRAPVRDMLIKRTAARTRVMTTDYASARMGPAAAQNMNDLFDTARRQSRGPVVDVEEVDLARRPQSGPIELPE